MSNPRYIDANAEIEKAKALLKDETIEHSSVANPQRIGWSGQSMEV